MPVVSMMRMSGDPDDLATRLREHVQPVARASRRSTAASATSSPAPTTACW